MNNDGEVGGGGTGATGGWLCSGPGSICTGRGGACWYLGVVVAPGANGGGGDWNACGRGLRGGGERGACGSDGSEFEGGGWLYTGRVGLGDSGQ